VNSNDTRPLVTTIIPTYNRKDSLHNVLRALAQQTYPLDLLQVIVVDDGSQDDTPSIANESSPFALRYIRQAHQGATVARNRAANEARGDILQYLDDDITVVPGFIAAMVSAHQRQDRLIAVGTLQPVARSAMTPFEKIYGPQTSTPLRQDGAEWEPLTFADCLTGMPAVKRQHFFDIGMLQDLAGDGRVAWSDVDFGYRAHRLGFQFVRCYQAIGYHDDFSIRDLTTYSRRWERTSLAAVKLFRTYPEVEPYLPMFKDKGRLDWQHDSPGLIARKLARHVMASRPALWLTERITRLVECVAPMPALLRPLYRWVVGSYVFRGYQQGLGQYSERQAPGEKPSGGHRDAGHHPLSNVRTVS
jgi:glycosyltransferase involved in cell wall biosynthesis